MEDRPIYVEQKHIRYNLTTRLFEVSYRQTTRELSCKMTTESVSHGHVNSAAQPIGQFAFSAVFATAVHPMTVARVLIQVRN